MIFEYKGRIIHYFIKDIDLKKISGKEMAQGIMIICDENDNQKEVFSIYDEKYKVIYAMANYALRWYDNHQNERKKIFNKSR